MIIKRLRYKLLLAFLSIFLILLAAFSGSLFIYSKKMNVTRTIRNIDDARILAFKNFKLSDDFLTYEVENEEYFKTEVSRITKEIEYNYFEIVYKLEKNKNYLETAQPALAYYVGAIIHAEKEYIERFNTLEQLVLKRGFKDYGIEGRMRLYAHKLMQVKDQAIETKVLMLRRHEKDFIIRKDAQYFMKFLQVSRDLQNFVRQNKPRTEIYIDLENTILNYRKYFTDYFNVQNEIGITENEGVLYRLNDKYKEIDRLFDREKLSSLKVEEQYAATLKYYYIVLILFSVILALVFSFFYSWQISNRAINLKNSIEAYINSGFREMPVMDKEIKITELEVIARGFTKMAKEIDTYINFFKQKVEERTAEITRQKEKIQRQKQLLSEKNRSLTDSILYAERIQKAILPPVQHFKSEFTDSFIFYQPRDIVSGDFYWMQVVNTKKEERPVLELEGSYAGREDFMRHEPSHTLYGKKVLFAVADCTGHGVPGAFMSIVGHNHLDKIVNEYGLSSPSVVLNRLNTGILSTLRQDAQDQATLKDGMEIALCAYDPEKRTLRFAGANKSIYLVRKGHLYEFKGNKKPIGVVDARLRSLKYEDIEIKIQKEDRIYLFTDGYQDQFGGRHDKKFKTKNFKSLLLQTADLGMDEQLEMVKNNFYAWKGKNFQVDDILVTGIKF